MKTVTDLLGTMQFKLNQSELARALNVSRTTLRKYMADTKGEYHQIRMLNGSWQLLALTHKPKSL